MAYLEESFLLWIRKYGDEKDKNTLCGSGLPSEKDRQLGKRAYKKYLIWLKKNNIRSYLLK